MDYLAIFALGPLRIELDGKPLQTSRHKALALLVYLALHPGNQSRESLSALLWPDYEQEKASAYLRRTLWEINTLLGDGWLDADRDGIGFNPQASLLLDITEFQSHLEAFQQHEHPANATCPDCIAHLHAAARLYRGDFLVGLSLRDSAGFEDWQFFQAEVYRRDYASALQKLVVLLRLKSAFDEATLFALRWLALDNLNEQAQRALMEIHSLDGQRNSALHQYQECCQLLQEELGVAPEPATTNLYAQILAGKLDRGEETKTIPGVNSQPASSNWLGEMLFSKELIPAGILLAQNKPFIGRRLEMEQVTRRLADPDCWLLTLLGPGGIGKTRLAVEVGLRQPGSFPQGVFFVPLNAVESEQSIEPAIASAVGLTFRQNGPAPEEQLLDFLREKQLLLILDSFERLIQSADLLGKIHFHAPGVKLLVTSRHRLPLQGAWVIEVGGLDFPQNPPKNLEDCLAFPSIELFLQSALRAKAGFRIVESDIAPVARITKLLEGMPLGLELAATWIKTLACQEIADEIHHSLDFLDTSLQDLPERQRSIRAVFDYSWNLMNNREQRTFPRLAVFQGSFTRRAAEQVAGISLRDLAGLVDKSLVQRTSTGRFTLHDLLRQYGLENLNRLPADGQETQDRHSEFYCSRLAEWNAALGSAGQGQALRELEADLENIRAAWDWSLSHDRIEWLEKGSDGLCMFFLRRARFVEGLTTCQRAEAVIKKACLDKAAPVADQKLRARLLIWQAVLNINLENLMDAGHSLHDSQIILDGPGIDPQQTDSERIFLWITQALLANLQHDAAATLDFYRRSLALSQKSTGKTPRWSVYYWRFLMDGAVSPEFFRQMQSDLQAVRETGDPFDLACHLFLLGIAEAFHSMQINTAERLLMESCEIFKTLDDPVSQVMIFKTLGYLLSLKGHFDEDLALRQRELAIYQELGDRRSLGVAHSEAGEILFHLGKYAEAEDEIRIGLALVQGRSDYEYFFRHRYLGDVLLARGKPHEAFSAYQLSYRFFESVNEKGWTFTALTGLSRTELALGMRTEAWEHAIQALRLYSEVKLYTFFAYLTLAQIALLLLDKGETIRALELHGLVVQQPFLSNSCWFADLYGRIFEEAAARLPQKEQSAVRENPRIKNIIEAVEYILTRPANTDPE